MYDVIVIGAGPGGMNAAIYANRSGLSVLMLEKGAPGGQMVNTAEIENYIGFESIAGADLSLKMFDHALGLGVEYGYGNVTGIKDNGKTKTVVTEDNEYEAKAVIIATGTVPRNLGAENEERFSGVGISWCAICDGPLFKGKDVVVVGGGNSAVEEAVYLAGIVNKVTIIARKALRANKEYIHHAEKKENIEFLLNTSVTKWLGDEKISGAEIINNETGETSTLDFDGAFLFIGFNPNTSMFEDLGIVGDDRYIIANQNMETSVPGIFACGDVIQKEIRQVVTAVGDGAIAAMRASKYIENLD